MKKIEAFARSKILMRDPWLNSCIRPSMYQLRFLRFIRKQMLNTHKSDSRKMTQQAALFNYSSFMD